MERGAWGKELRAKGGGRRAESGEWRKEKRRVEEGEAESRERRDED
jgi:hypothetical protein